MGEDDSRPPTSINDRYVVLRELGRGGMGRVYLVEDSHRNDRRMALKTLLPQTTDELLTTGFREEFAQLAKLNHTNLAKAYDFGRIAGRDEYFFTTEYIVGTDLLSGTEDASMERLLQITAQLLRALEFIHSHGLLHNDLKPANILLERRSISRPSVSPGGLAKLEEVAYGLSGRVKVIDFGLISREGTAWQKVLGTPRYLSPERITRAAADRRSDLYSLGIVLYVLFAGRPPFHHPDSRTLLRMHLETPAPPLQSFRTDLPEPVLEFVHRLIEKQPGSRFQSASEALKFLGSALGWHDHDDAVPSTSNLQPTRLSAGALIHRDAELEALKGHYEAMLAGKSTSHAVAVLGPPGVGKSRLVEELRGDVQVAGGNFVEISGSGVQRNLQPIVDALEASLKTSGRVDLRMVKDMFSAKDADDSKDLSSRLEKLVLLISQKTPTLFFFDDFDRASRTVRSFVGELVHAADSAPQGESSPRLLVVISQRSSGELRFGNLARLELTNFPADKAGSFLQRVFKQEDIPRHVEDRLVKLSEGNPLFLLELANHLVEHKKVIFVGTRWVFPDSLHTIALPDSLANVLQSKLLALKSDCRQVLNWLAVAGHGLTHGILKRCVAVEPDALRGTLEDMVQNSLLAEQERGGIKEYHLVSTGIRDALLEDLSEKQKQQIHQGLAQSLAEELPEAEAQADVLAEHWLEAGNQAAFLRYAPGAAELLRQRGDLRKAAEYHQRIIQGMPDNAVAKKVKSLAKLSEMHEFLWDLEACRQDVAEIQRLGGALLKPADRAMLLRRLGCVELARHRYTLADSLLTEAGSLLEHATGPVRLAVLAPRAWTLWLMGRQEESLRTLEETETGLAALVPQDDRQKLLLMAAANQAANQRQHIGHLEKAGDLFSRNLKLLEGMEQKQPLAATLCAAGSVLLEQGRYAEAVKRLRAALEISKEIGDYRTLSRTRERLGDYYLRFGKVRQALQVAQAALQNAENIKNLTAVASSLRMLGRIHLYTNQVREARRNLNKAAALHGKAGDVFNRCMSRLHLTRLHVEEDDLDEAKRLLAVCESDADRYGFTLPKAQCFLWSFVSLWKSTRQYDGELVKKARRVLDEHGYRGELIDFLCVQFEVEFEAGHVETTGEVLAELEQLSKSEDQPDLSCELMYFAVLLKLRQGGFKASPLGMQKMARSRNKLRLIHRCEALLEAIRAPDPTTV